MYFPLIVEEALMVEPTETESRETLDEAVAVLKTIRARADKTRRGPPRRPGDHAYGPARRGRRRPAPGGAVRLPGGAEPCMSVLIVIGGGPAATPPPSGPPRAACPSPCC